MRWFVPAGKKVHCRCVARPAVLQLVPAGMVCFRCLALLAALQELSTHPVLVGVGQEVVVVWPPAYLILQVLVSLVHVVGDRAVLLHPAVIHP